MEAFQTALCWTAWWDTSCIPQFSFHTMDGWFMASLFFFICPWKFCSLRFYSMFENSFNWNLHLGCESFTTVYFWVTWKITSGLCDWTLLPTKLIFVLMDFAGELATELTTKTMDTLRRTSHGCQYVIHCLYRDSIITYILQTQEKGYPYYTSWDCSSTWFFFCVIVLVNREDLQESRLRDKIC